MAFPLRENKGVLQDRLAKPPENQPRNSETAGARLGDCLADAQGFFPPLPPAPRAPTSERPRYPKTLPDARCCALQFQSPTDEGHVQFARLNHVQRLLGTGDVHKADVRLCFAARSLRNFAMWLAGYVSFPVETRKVRRRGWSGHQKYNAARTATRKPTRMTAYFRIGVTS